MAESEKQPTLQTATLMANIRQDLEVLFASTSESILLIEANGTILAANNISAKWLNQDAESLTNNNLFQLLTPFGIPIREWAHDIATKKTSQENETQFNNRFIRVRLIPIVENKKVRRLIVIGQDVTDQRKAEEQVREFTEQMERKVQQRTAKLEAITQKLAEEKRYADLRASLSQHLMQNAQDYKSMMDYITTELTNLIGDTSLIALFTSSLTLMEVQSIKDRNTASQTQQQTQLLNQRINVEGNPIVNCILQGKRYSAAEIDKEIGEKILPQEFTAQLGKRGLSGLEVFPLYVGDHPLGVLAIARENGRPFSIDEITFIDSLTGTIALAIQNARLFERLTESQNQLRGLSQKLVKVQENHFSELTGEIHDRIGQDMTAINVNINIMQALLPRDVPQDISQRLADTEALVQNSVKQMRSLMAELRPPMLDQYGLAATLFWYCEQFQRRTEIQVMINDLYMKNKRLPSDVEIAFFRIAQEALNNISKHAKATQVEVELFSDMNNIMMAITDNGVGFDATKPNPSSLEHWGLALMEERARAVNGDFLLRSVRRQGTQVIVRVRGNA